MRDLNYLPPFRNGKMYRIAAIINGVERLVIFLHHADLAECAAVEAMDCRTLDDVLALKMRYSELEFYRETETNTHIANGTKGARAKYTPKRCCVICDTPTPVRALNDQDVCRECAGS